MAEKSRKGNGGGRGNAYDRRERKLWLIGAKVSMKYGLAPYGGNGLTVNCVHCARLLTMETLEADRILPGSRGGTYRYDNVQPSCRSCNIARGDHVGNGVVRSIPGPQPTGGSDAHHRSSRTPVRPRQ